MAKKDEAPKRGPRERSPGTVDLQVSARLLDIEDHEKKPSVVAYAFDRGGRLLARAKLSDAGRAKLALPIGEEGRAVRVVVGEEVEGEEVSAADLIRRGGEGRMIRLRPGDKLAPVEIAFPAERWLCWLRGFCLVQGRLLKRYERDGVTIEAPVCNAEVEIFEVDPFYLWLRKVPDLELERVRELLIDPKLLDVHLERPRKIPEPGPLPPIGELELSPAARAVGATRIGPNLVASRAFNPQPEPPAAIQSQIPQELVFAAQTASPQGLRQSLLRFPDLGRLILCRIFPRFVTLQKLGTVKTDSCGRFQRLVSLGCQGSDVPDLYFRAHQRLFGFLDVEIYAPKPIACNTWWNYKCGTEITLYTNHPFAQTCAPCPSVNAPPKWVLAMAIGNTRLDRIYGTSPALQSATTAANRGMLAPSSPGGFDQPFGGLCRLRLEFDSSDLRDAGIRYYRVSWRKGSSGAWAPLSGSVVRHYHKEVGSDLVLKVYPLGPTTVPVTGTATEEANLFEIPPALPPEGNWSFPDVVEDTTNAKFVTHTLPPVGDSSLTEEEALLAQAGDYELKVDLFYANGKQVQLATELVTYRVPDGEDSEDNVNTENAATLGLVSGDSLILPLHVDNNSCTAVIAPPQIGTTPALGSCGVLLYDDKAAPPETVTMPFTADHPNGHATYSFLLKRGIDYIDSVAGKVPGGSLSEPIDDALLGPCKTATGGVAAYAEHLYVTALATNGWSRLYGYDAGDVAAFVLTPKKPGGGPGSP